MSPLGKEEITSDGTAPAEGSLVPGTWVEFQEGDGSSWLLWEL